MEKTKITGKNCGGEGDIALKSRKVVFYGIPFTQKFYETAFFFML